MFRQHLPVSRSRGGAGQPSHSSQAGGKGKGSSQEWPLDESEEEVEETGKAVLADAGVPSASDAALATLAKFLDSYQKGPQGAKGPLTLERALDGARGGGSHESSLPSTRRNSAARKALRDALTASPAKISSVIEGLMAEDLASSF